MLGREMGGLAEQIGLVSGGRRFAWAIPLRRSFGSGPEAKAGAGRDWCVQCPKFRTVLAIDGRWESGMLLGGGASGWSGGGNRSDSDGGLGGDVLWSSYPLPDRNCPWCKGCCRCIFLTTRGALAHFSRAVATASPSRRTGRAPLAIVAQTAGAQRARLLARLGCWRLGPLICACPDLGFGLVPWIDAWRPAGYCQARRSRRDSDSPACPGPLRPIPTSTDP